MTASEFRITKRHYDILIKQAQTNFPQECGGFLGGKDMTISAILPTFNQHLFNKTDTYSVTMEDIERAHLFFNQHGLEYFGIYHTHPKASALPSDQDLKHIQKFMFIISLLNFEKPDFAAYTVKGRQYQRLPLKIIQHTDVKDIHGKGSSADTPTDKTGSMAVESDRLSSQLSDYIHNEKISYPKFSSDPYKSDSDFNTLA